MATYGENYFRVLEKTSSNYLALHNLNALNSLDLKLKCYKQHQQQPHEYYQCFRNIETQTENESKTLNN